MGVGVTNALVVAIEEFVIGVVLSRRFGSVLVCLGGVALEVLYFKLVYQIVHPVSYLLGLILVDVLIIFGFSLYVIICKQLRVGHGSF